MIRPTRGKIFARVIKPEKQTASGLFLADSLKREIPDRVKVLAVGSPGIDRKGKEVKSFAYEGCVLYCKKYSGKRYSEDGDDFVFLTNNDVIGRC